MLFNGPGNTKKNETQQLIVISKSLSIPNILPRKLKPPTIDGNFTIFFLIFFLPNINNYYDKKVALFTKILTIKNCRKCKTKIKKSFTKIITIILKNSPNFTVKLLCHKCNILNVREIFVLSFIVSKKIEKKMDDALALRLENKTAIHR
jgi:hypothetical protein